MDEVEFFWRPPRAGEEILGLVKYRDMLIIATTDGVYTITPPNSEGLSDHEVRQVSDEIIRKQL
jgi:hypothetical protein